LRAEARLDGLCDRTSQLDVSVRLRHQVSGGRIPRPSGAGSTERRFEQPIEPHVRDRHSCGRDAICIRQDRQLPPQDLRALQGFKLLE
jgi:hypothetical protein